MSQVAITRVHEGQDTESSFADDVKALHNRIRERAFAIFQEREPGDGDAESDWLQAERDLICAAESNLIEEDSGFQLNVAVPGFAEKDIKVTALPDALVVSAETKRQHDTDSGTVHFCDFSEKHLLSQFSMPGAIDVDKVSAQVEKGMLHITAAKARQQHASVAA
jgi:HSP20 family molecular chaperone IbpA